MAAALAVSAPSTEAHESNIERMIQRSFSLCMIALLLQVGVANAASLDKETCDKLKVEQAQLEGTGVRGTMAKGPEWAKANLAADKLGEIKRLLELDELLLFRCQGRPLVVLPPEVELDPAAKTGEGKEDGQEADAKGTEKKAPPPAKKAPAPARQDRGRRRAQGEGRSATKDGLPKKADAAAKAGAPAPAKAAKPKPKSDDAYRPPGASTGAPAGKLSP